MEKNMSVTIAGDVLCDIVSGFLQGIREFLFAYGYFVGFFVFVQVTFDMGRFVQFAFYQTEIVFMERSVMEDSG